MVHQKHNQDWVLIGYLLFALKVLLFAFACVLSKNLCPTEGKSIVRKFNSLSLLGMTTKKMQGFKKAFNNFQSNLGINCKGDFFTKSVEISTQI